MSSPARSDVYIRVTQAIIAAIEAGPGGWRMPWHHSGADITRPTNVASGKPYRGINSAPYRREKKEVSNERSGSLVMTCTHRTYLGQKWLRSRKRRGTTACPEKAQSVEAICGVAGQGKTCMAKAILPEPQFAATYTRSGAAEWLTRIARRLRGGQDYYVAYKVQGETRSIKIWKLKDLVPTVRRYGVVDAIPRTPFVYHRTELVERLNARVCERCGRDDLPCEVHHVRRLSDHRRDDDYLSYMRAARLRKRIVLCVDCHEKVHSYRPYTRPPRQLGSGEPDAVKAARPVRREAEPCSL